MSLTGDGWGGFVKNKKASGVLRARLRACSIEFAHGNGRICAFEPSVYSRERESRSKKETDLPSAAALSAARRGTGCRVSAPGHFYRLLLPLYPHRRGVSRMGDSLEDSVEHHVVDFIALHILRSPPLIYDAFHGAFERRAAF